MSGDGRHTVGQLRLRRVLCQRTDIVGAQFDQVIDDASADVSCGAGHENGHDFQVGR
jgi:hypothetical protein